MTTFANGENLGAVRAKINAAITAVDALAGSGEPGDTAHGTRGGGALHANAVPNVSAGFISGADQALLNRMIGVNIALKSGVFLR